MMLLQPSTFGKTCRCFTRSARRAPLLRLGLIALMAALALGAGARQAAAFRGARVGDALDDQAYLDQLNLTLADVQANLSSVQYYLPLGSLHDSYDPTWQLVLDSAQALASDADEIQTLSPPDRFAAAQASLVGSIGQISDSAGSAVNAYEDGDTATAQRALIELNDATIALLQARSVSPAGAATPPATAGTPPPPSNLSIGDGTSASAPAALGAPLNVGPGWQVRVLTVDFDAWQAILRADPSNSAPARGERMVLIQVSVTNEGSAPDRLRYSDFAVTGASGERYLPFATNTTCGDVPAQLDVTLAPGVSAVGNICVQAPSHEANLELVSNYHLDGAGARFFAVQ